MMKKFKEWTFQFGCAVLTGLTIIGIALASIVAGVVCVPLAILTEIYKRN
jgi:hypothetical protein